LKHAMRKAKRFNPKGFTLKGVATTGSTLRGFTLIEVMVAMFLLAIIGTAGFTMLQQITKARTRIEVQSDRLTELQRTFYWLAEDITQITDRPVRSAVDSILPAFQFNLQGSSLFDFTRAGWSNPAADILPPRSTLQRVSYSLEDDRLIRSYWYHLDSLSEEPDKRRQLLKDVEELTVRFLDGEGGWQDQWPPLNIEGDAGLPRALEFTFILGDLGSVVRVFGLPG